VRKKTGFFLGAILIVLVAFSGSANATARVLLDITFEELDHIFDYGSERYPEKKKREMWRGYKGKYVQWNGRVSFVESRGSGLNVGFRHGASTPTYDVVVYFPGRSSALRQELRQGRVVTYEGRLWDRETSSGPYFLDDGRLAYDVGEVEDALDDLEKKYKDKSYWYDRRREEIDEYHNDRVWNLDERNAPNKDYDKEYDRYLAELDRLEDEWARFEDWYHRESDRILEEYDGPEEFITKPGRRPRSGKKTRSLKPKKGTTVFITEGGRKYHKAKCRYVKEDPIDISLKNAKANGYKKCSVCFPPK